MIKRIILFLVMIMLSMYMITGCGSGVEKNNDFVENELTIVTSFYPMYLHVINITKDIPAVKVINMTQPQTGCLHDYQLTPNDLKTLDEADIFVINGGGMEDFIEKSVSQLPEMKIIDASEDIELIGGHDDHVNPHVWVSVTGAIEQVKQITKELGKMEPHYQKKYNENANGYIEKLEVLSQEMHEALEDIPNKNIVTFHEAFPYFAEEFDLNIIGTIVAEPDSEPSAQELCQIIEDIKEHNVKAVFAEPQYDSKAVDVIAKEANVELYTLDPVTTGKIGEDQMDQYLLIMRENLKTLEEALR